MSDRRLKIAYISGPANARLIYGEWSSREQQAYFGTDYMKEFVQLASELGAESHVVTWYGDKRESFRLGDFTFDNRPISTATGLSYYLDQLTWGVGVLFRLIRFRPDLLLLTGNQNFWWLLSPLRLLGTKFVASYHAVLWHKLPARGFALRLMSRLNGTLILRHAAAVLVTSKDIRRQVEEVLGKDAGGTELIEHLPTYSPQQFAGIRPAPPPHERPFRVMFLGRMVENKGIYDIVEMAAELERDHPGEYRFDLCGAGSELDRLRERISKLGLDHVVICHGFCAQEQVSPLLDASHVCIVPTRSDCEAGFEMTCAEAILAGRPLITSRVCPALEYLAPAAVEATPDDADTYRRAILQLSTDGDLFEAKRRACGPLQQQFYDPANSWSAAMKNALERHILPRAPATAARVNRKGKVAADVRG